ncbi:RNA-binding protein [Aestuariivirga litoralis]|uniref:RNA-binding protein n=1 Tax=Aestuariivirga litoralis TaxID=2650924 RepID=UPI0018C5D385|nr:RNA-binding protein [Aestuariivirga litoralis]
MPERTCIVTRVQKPDTELIRFVLSPEGQVVPDLKRKLPGRGCWVSKSRETLGEALKRNSFARALDKEAKADPGLPDLVGVLIRKDVVQALSLCRKAGLATSGNSKVEDALGKGHVKVLIHVAGSSPDGAAKLNRHAGPDCVILDFFVPQELDLAFGRENVVHAAVNEGGQARNLLDLAGGLAQYENLKIKGLN